MTFRVFVNNGRIAFKSENAELRFRMWAQDNEGKELSLIFEKPKRSLSQNSLYWVYLSHIEAETGNNAVELHEIFKRMFLPAKTIIFKDKEIRVAGSTTDLNKSDFTDYMDKISAYTEIPIPDPQEAGYIPNHIYPKRVKITP